MTYRNLVQTFLSAVLLVFSTGSLAGIISYDLEYFGSGGSSATGTGMVSFDDTVLPNPVGGIFLTNETTATLGIVDFELTISGTVAGNGDGTFDLSDITKWIWRTTAALDLTQEITGQPGYIDFNLGTSGQTPGSPVGVGGSTIAVAGGERLVLRSMSPSAVPEPGTLVLLGLGLAGLGAARRREGTV